MIILSQIGVCCAYLIFLYQSTDVVLNQINIPLSKLTIFSLTLILIIPLSLIRRMKYFHQVSKIGFYVNLLTFIIIFFDCLIIVFRDGISYRPCINLQNTFQFIGIACLTLQCNLTILPIRNDMINKQPFQRYQELSLFICFFIAILITTFAIWGYKDNLNQIIIFNIQNLYLRSITMIAYGICILMTYALQLFPAVQIIEQHISQLSYKTFDESEDENESVFVLDKNSLIIRGLLMLTIYIISYKIPDLSQFINLIGSFFGSFCQFLIPLLAHWICFKNQEASLRLKMEYFLMSIFTVLAIVFGSYESIKGLI
ncbi:unnamed protein product [Paramecium pentaurelia]|uniref:Amino acid transporter transmembrane domain-containing protein n=1 Tax=Paramecium pentaurelia TaxID=43138 RepID=A0A8S1XHQ7_9CILI|nr:unnamed protein product [Paramecium pentaurelia]